MKRKKKRILAFLLALTLMVSLMSRDQLFVAAENTQAVETESSAETQIVEENGQQDDVVTEAQNVSEEQPAVYEDLPAEDADDSDPEQSGDVNGEGSTGESPVSTEESTETVTTQSPSEETSTVESSSTEEVSETEETATEETTEEETTEETEETETLMEEEIETEDGSYKGSEDDPWEAKADGIKIKAYADKGVLPEDAVMVVSKLSEDSEEYKKARELVEASGTEFNEMMALDISFEAENDEGEAIEIEPDGTVRVTMELPEIIPANVEEDSLTINHIKENEEGELLEAVPVADKGNDTEGTIEVVDTASEDTQDVKAEFVTDGFSVFTVTWTTISLYSQLTLDISDSVKINGLFTAVYEGEVSTDADVTYSWYRSDGGNSWTEVKREKITGDSYNITEDGRSINVALDNGAQKWYKVTMLINGEEAATSDPIQVKYYDSLQNGSFEEPICTTSYQPYLDGGAIDVVWRTTASDNKIEYVSADPSKYDGQRTHQDLSETYHKVDAAADGTQFAELNANLAGALYQDVLTTPGSEIYWRVSHRGRGNDRGNGRIRNDYMYVVIVSANKAEEDNIVTQNAVEDLIRNIESGNEEYIGAFAKQYGATNVKWVEHGGTYVVPEGQYLTRFFFVAGSTASGDETVGNHIDKVWFSTELPPPSPDKGHLTVTKTVDGLTSEEMEAYSVKITIGNEEYILSNFTENADGSYSASHTFEDLEANSYTVSENVIKEIENFDTKYTENSTVEVGGNTITGKSIEAIIEDGKTTVVNFTNTYEKKNSDLIIVKQFSNLSEDEINGLLDTLTFTVTNGVDVNRNSLLTKNSDGTYSVCFAELQPGEYIVTESGYELEGYYCTVSNDISGSNETNTVKATLERGVDKRITFTNAYTYREKRTITVNKTVTGDMGDREKKFGFTIEVKDGNETVSVDGIYEIGENETITVVDGKFSLTSGQSLTFVDILDGCVFKVTENDYDDVGYTTTTAVSGLVSSNYEVNGNKVDGILKDGNVVISYTNAYRVVSPPTGIFQNTTPYLLILLFGIVVAMWFKLTRRKNTDI